MNIKPKHILIFTIVIIFFVIGVWPSDQFKIEEIQDGNTVLLSNGATVKLIGVSSSKDGYNDLKSLEGKSVILQPDNSNFFDPTYVSDGMTVYCYLLLDKKYNYECLNATLLKKGLANLVNDTFLTDSLKAFTKYAERGKSVNPNPPEPYHDELDYDDEGFDLPDRPTPVFHGEESRAAFWTDDTEANLKMLEASCDYMTPYTKSFANQLAAKAPGNFSVEQVCEVFDYCYSHWSYVNDPNGQEYLARASESIASSLTGDCDDFAVLMASCILAIGGNANVICAFGNQGGHAYTEVDVTTFENGDIGYIRDVIRKRYPHLNIDVHTRDDKGRKWLNLDWQCSYPGGNYFEASTRLNHYCINGHWQS